MWCTRWYLPLLLLPFPTAPPFFLLVLLFSLTLHARPCLYCIVLLVALFTSSCYWAPTPLDIPSYALESVYPSLATSRPTLDLQSLLNAPEPTATSAVPTPRVTYSARLERPKRCWCTPYELFEPFNMTRWDQRSSVLVFPKRSFWDWLLDEEAEQSERDATSAGGKSGEKGAATTAMPPVQTVTSWRTKWNALGSYFSSRPTQQEDSTPKPKPETQRQKAKPVEQTKHATATPTPTITATAIATATADKAAPTAPPAVQQNTAQLPWWQKQYDLRPHGGGVIVDFRWGRG